MESTHAPYAVGASLYRRAAGIYIDAARQYIVAPRQYIVAPRSHGGEILKKYVLYFVFLLKTPGVCLRHILCRKAVHCAEVSFKSVKKVFVCEELLEVTRAARATEESY